MKGVRHFLRDFTATAVREHLRSEIEATDALPALTRNEIELVRSARVEQDATGDLTSGPAQSRGASEWM